MEKGSENGYNNKRTKCSNNIIIAISLRRRRNSRHHQPKAKATMALDSIWTICFGKDFDVKLIEHINTHIEPERARPKQIKHENTSKPSSQPVSQFVGRHQHHRSLVLWSSSEASIHLYRQTYARTHKQGFTHSPPKPSTTLEAFN